MSELPRYSDREDQRDVIGAFIALPQIEVKQFELLSAWPKVVRFSKITRPIAVSLGGIWEKQDPEASPAVTGFVWVHDIDGISISFTGPTANKMQVVTLIAYGER